MEAHFNSFNLDVTWKAFGDADRSDLDDLLSTNNIHGEARLNLVSLWKNHPNKATGWLAILFDELKLLGYREYAQYVFWFRWITKPDVKNGKLWYNDIGTRYPVRAFVFIRTLFMLFINYVLFVRRAAEVKEGCLKKGVLENLV